MDHQKRQMVVFTLPAMRQYRLAFFEDLRVKLDGLGIDTEVVYSSPVGTEAVRGDTVEIPWGHLVDTRVLKAGPYHLTWQSSRQIVRKADLVVVQQANRRLENYLMLVHQAFGGPKVAYWGHGRNFQAATAVQHASERLKRLITGQAHWFFSYNSLSTEALLEIGFPQDRITTVDNSIDTRSLAEARDRVTEDHLSTLRSRLGITSDNVGLFAGAMYKEKRLPFLVEASRVIRSQVPDFEMICIGSGVERHVIDQAAEEHHWFHAVGPQFGDDLAAIFALARVLLLPGLVGLTVLDSFVLRVPIITTAEALHSPEIAYLDNGVNGVIVEGDGSDGAFANAAVEVLTDEGLHRRLVEGCMKSAPLYSIEQMADRFVEGVVDALATEPTAARWPRRRRRSMG